MLEHGMHVIGWLLHMERERMHLEGGRDEGTCRQTRGGENRRESAKQERNKEKGEPKEEECRKGANGYRRRDEKT